MMEKPLSLSKARLALMHSVLSGYIERGDIPGLAAVVACRDDVHLETMGALSFAGSAQVKRDTMFRIASLSKLITAAAAMILVEECRLRLDDPVDRWLPELANRRVLKDISSEIDDTVPAVRPITVRDLLTYRMGFGSVMAMPDTYPIQKWIREYRLGGDGPPRPSQAPAMDEWLRRLGSLPLIAQPGERWMYHISGETLGMLIARVSGQSFGAFLQQRIFDPLGMKDTGFFVPPEKIDRLASQYMFNQETNKLDLYDDAAKSDWSSPPPAESGGRRPCLYDRRLFCVQPDAAEQRPIWRSADSFRCDDRSDDLRSSHRGPALRLGNVLRYAFELGLGIRRRHPPQRDLSQSRPLRLDGRLRNGGLCRSRERDDRYSIHAAHDGIAGSSARVHRFLDAGMRNHAWALSKVGAIW